MILQKQCVKCSEMAFMQVMEEEYQNYCEGKMLIQDCFPHMSADYREMLISGICPTCWDKIFGKEE